MKKLDIATRANVLADYLGGETIAVIAERYGVHPTYPNLLARRAGLETRGRSAKGMEWLKKPRGKYRKKPHIEERNTRILTDLSSGKSVTYVAKSFGLSTACVCMIVKRAARAGAPQ